MSAYVHNYKINPFLRQYTAKIVKSLPAKDWNAEVNAVFQFVQSNIRYLQDTYDVELLHDPLAVLQIGQGDCDDMGILLATMLASIGYLTRFVAVGFAPGVYDHVFVQVCNPDSQQWISADPTEPDPLGWFPPGIVSQMTMLNDAPQS